MLISQLSPSNPRTFPTDVLVLCPPSLQLHLPLARPPDRRRRIPYPSPLVPSYRPRRAEQTHSGRPVGATCPPMIHLSHVRRFSLPAELRLPTTCQTLACHIWNNSSIFTFSLTIDARLFAIPCRMQIIRRGHSRIDLWRNCSRRRTLQSGWLKYSNISRRREGSHGGCEHYFLCFQ